MKSILYCTILFLSFLSTDAGLITSLDKDSVTVGERFRLEISIPLPHDATIITPDAEKGLDWLSLRNTYKETTPGSEKDTLNYAYEMIAFTPGDIIIPRLRFIIGDGHIQDTVFSREMSVNISTFIPHEAKEIDIQNLKPPQRVGRSGLLWLWILLFLCVFVAVFCLGKKYLTRKTEKDIYIPPKPAYLEAMESLERLEKKSLIEKGYIREYVFELSEIFKRYIGRRYNVNASEFTTEEMRLWLELSDLGKEEKKSADWFFCASDPVKFAKEIPEIRTIRRFSNELKFFLKSTKPEAETADNGVGK